LAYEEVGRRGRDEEEEVRRCCGVVAGVSLYVEALLELACFST